MAPETPTISSPPASTAVVRSAWTETRDLPPVLERVQPYTMVPRDALTELARQVRAVLDQRIPGAFVECGTWRGGCSFLMAELLRLAGDSERKVWMFDSFEGIPPPAAIDGAAAQTWVNDTSSPWYHDNLRVSLEDVKASAAALGLESRVELVKGYFDRTLAAARGRIGPIALLRIDADWHASVSCCLEQLVDQVSPGGLVVFDDYFAYEGCAIAVHEFLGRRSLPHRIEAIGDGPEAPQVAFATGKKTWRWMRETYRLNQELADILTPAGPFVLIDQEQLRIDLAQGNLAIPFLETEGQYGGPPADDAAAIEALRGMTARGATHLVVTWPCFWWLEYYTEFAVHLREHHRLVMNNPRARVFDLRGG